MDLDKIIEEVELDLLEVVRNSDEGFVLDGDYIMMKRYIWSNSLEYVLDRLGIEVSKDEFEGLLEDMIANVYRGVIREGYVENYGYVNGRDFEGYY